MIPLIKPFIGEEELMKVKEVLESGYLTEGSFTQEFEKKFAKYVGSKYAIAVCNATVGIEMVLKCIGVTSKDEIIVPDFTHPATADATYLAGGECVLVDVDLESRNTTFDLVKNAINKNTKATIPVSEFGNPLDESFYDLKDEVFILEDAAPSIGAEINGKKVGSFADATVFSFHPRKILTTGEGGMITTDDDELYEKLVSFKKFGEKHSELGRFSFESIGTNYKLSNILSALGLVQLDKLETILKDRIKKAEYYNKLFSETEKVAIPNKKNGTRHTYQSYTLYVKESNKRDFLIQKLKDREIQTQIGTYALHRENAFSKAKKIGELANSLKLFNNLLTLPLYYSMTKEEQETVFNNVMELL